MRKRKGLAWLTGILMIAVFGLSSLAGWMVWQRQAASPERKGGEQLFMSSSKEKETLWESKNLQEGETDTQAGQGEADAVAQQEAKTESESRQGLPDGSGTQQETAAESQPPQQEITLLFAGDVYFSNYVLNAYDQAGGIRTWASFRRRVPRSTGMTVSGRKSARQIFLW